MTALRSAVLPGEGGGQRHTSLSSEGTLRYSSPGYTAARCRARTGSGGAHTGTEDDPAYN